MPTNFTSGRFAGALTVVGLLTAGTVVFTTLTVGTGNFTTLNASGTSTQRTVNVGGTLTAQNATVTGATIVKTLSGSSTATLSVFAPRLNQLVCFKAGGVLGYIPVSATGVIALTAGVATCQ